MTLLAFIGTLGWQELLVVLLFALLLFGRRLPAIARGVGEGIVEFKRGLRGEPESPARIDVDKG